MLVCGSRFENL